MGLPQTILLALLAACMAVSSVCHGQMVPSSRHNCVADFAAFAILLALLNWGGFFR